MSTRIISHFRRVLTSFVPPIHIQGAGLAPLQGPALWKIFLPATGSFFGFVVTDLFGLIPLPAPSGGRFPGLFLIPFSFPVTAEFNPHRTSINAQFNCNKNILYLSSSLLCCLQLRPFDVSHQLLCIIRNTCCQYLVEDPQYLTGHCYHRLHLFQRIFFPCPVVLMYFPELRVLPYQRYCCFIQYISECYPAFYLVLNHPTFNQIKKKHGINYSDKFYIRLLYAVSFVLSY